MATETLRLFDHDIHLDHPGTPPKVAYDDSIPAYTLPAEDDAVRLLVFRAVRSGVAPHSLRPWVGWDALPDAYRKRKRNAKGSGLYCGFTPRSIMAIADANENAEAIGLYATPAVNTKQEILDARDGNPPNLWSYAKVFGREALYIVQGKISEESVVRGIDASYGEYPAVLLTPAPTVMAWERLRRGRQPFPPGWLLWRGAGALERIGTVHRDQK